VNIQKRPSIKELSKKLREAKEILLINEGIFAEPSKNLGELNKLDIETEELWLLIQKLLTEIEPKDYTGTRPPQKAYEYQILGSELFAFSWTSKLYGRNMYLKFVLRNNNFYLVSLHEDKPPKKRGI
jgi:hypothetical protein